MLPLKLTIEGLYSYQNRAEIDFTALTEAHIFGIFGAVGSGKSSILESISFALYGETERMNSRDERAYNMMNLKSNHLLIDFEFLAGDQKTYKFVASARRNSKQFSIIAKTERKAFVQDNNGDWCPIETKSAEKIIGLSYNNFKRTIIIPQGKFSEFLSLGDKDRTLMLKEIFGLDQYDYSRKVGIKEAQLNRDSSVLQGKLQTLQDFSEENTQEKQVLFRKVSEEVEQNKTRLILLEKENTDLIEVEKLFKKKAIFEKEKAEFDKHVSEKNTEKENLTLYKNIQIQLKPIFDQKVNNQNELIKIDKKLVFEKKQVTELETDLARFQEKMNALEVEFEGIPLLNQQSNELKNVLLIGEKKQKLDELSGRVGKGKDMLIKQNEQIILHESNYQNLLKEIEKEQKNAVDLDPINQAIQFKTQLSFLIEQLTTKQAELDKLKLENSAFEKQLISDFNEVPLEEYSAFLEAKISDLDKEESKVQEKKNHLTVQNSLVQYAEELNNGDSCPVCGSREHPNILSNKLLEVEKIELENTLNNLKYKTKEVKAKLQLFLRSDIKLKNNFNLVTTMLKQTQEQLINISELKERFNYKTLENKGIDELKEIVNTENSRRKEIQIKENSLKNIIATKNDLQSKYHQYEKGVRTFENSIHSIGSEIDVLKSQIEHYELVKILAKSSTEINIQLQYLTKKSIQITEDYRKVKGIVQAKRNDYSKSKERVEQFSIQQQEKKQLSEELEIKHKNSLIQLDLKWDKSIEELIYLKIDILEKEKEISDFFQRYATLKTQLEDLQKEAKDLTFDPERKKQVEHDLLHLKSDLENQIKEFNTLDHQIKYAIERLKEKESIQKEANSIQMTQENLKTIKQLMKGNGFVNYISKVYLKNLCEAANVRFRKLTRESLRLELNDSNNFLIRDYLNEGQTRSVKTLSGGQMFQASLCLAIALSDSIKQQNKNKQNFFFLDEGFGSLDNNALQLVFETLQSLKNENRVVGVISHVQELQQEFQTYLKIEKDNDTGSRVLTSWES